jgi:hypothetical protein
MYFDLEFLPASNPHVDGNMMVTVLLDLVQRGLRSADRQWDCLCYGHSLLSIM